MDGSRLIDSLPLVKQAARDPLGLGRAAQSGRSARLRPRTDGAKVVKSICPYCAVGCGQDVHVRDGQILQIEGDLDSPISRGRLCPKGSATKQLVTGPGREHTVKYRPKHGTEWQELSLERAMEMIADRVVSTRAAGWQEATDDGIPLRRTMSIGSLGG